MAIQYGVAPFLECSSRGEKRFSAFYARINRRSNRSIEELYQASKIFANGITNLSWQQAKGKRPINRLEAIVFYSNLWDEYMQENPHLMQLLVQASGLADFYGQKGSCCQAEELWRIRNNFILERDNL